MSKTFATTAITNELKGSVWFQRPTDPLPEATPSSPPATKPTTDQTSSQPQDQGTESTHASKLTSKKASKNASMLAVAPFTDGDLKALRQSTYNQLNVRGTEAEVEWLKDVAYQLSKEVKPVRVNQQDVIRVGMRLFQKLMDANKAELIRILKELK